MVRCPLTVAAMALAFGILLALRLNENQSPPWVDWATYSDAWQRLTNGASLYGPNQLRRPLHPLAGHDDGLRLPTGLAGPPGTFRFPADRAWSVALPERRTSPIGRLGDPAA